MLHSQSRLISENYLVLIAKSLNMFYFLSIYLYNLFYFGHYKKEPIRKVRINLFVQSKNGNATAF